MSRLDDELRNAFRREQVPTGFTERVLERIAQQPAPRPSWWRRLAMLLEPPRLRWVAIGVTASLLLALGAAQYGKLRRVTIEEGDKTSATQSSSGKSTSSVKPGGEVAQKDVKGPSPESSRNAKRNAALRRQLALARQQKEQKEQELRAQAEAAKEKLMLALHIASNALNDAQKAVHDDGPKP
jgi:hypothetical protein